MSISGLAIFAILSYSGWTMFNILERIKKDNDKITVMTYAEIAYSVLMIYLLIINSISFLYITATVVFVHVVMGLYMEIFKPELLVNSHIMTQFWTYLAIDISVSVISYLIIATSLA